METTTLTLTEFLLARIAEDEELAQAAGVVRVGYLAPVEAAHAARHDPARVLAECEAKRQRIAHYERIAAMADPVQHPLQEYVLAKGAVERQLRFDAAIHRDHPDYREEWAV